MSVNVHVFDEAREEYNKKKGNRCLAALSWMCVETKEKEKSTFCAYQALLLDLVQMSPISHLLRLVDAFLLRRKADSGRRCARHRWFASLHPCCVRLDLIAGTRSQMRRERRRRSAHCGGVSLGCVCMMSKCAACSSYDGCATACVFCFLTEASKFKCG